MQNEIQYEKRDSRFELLRLIGMYFVILTHESAFGIRDQIMPVAPEQMTASVIMNGLLNYPGTVFNVVFIILTGYFCVDLGVRYKRIVLLLIQLCVYAWITGAIFAVAGWQEMGGVMLIRTVLPMLTGYNWFINCYIIFSLFIPFINKGVRALTAVELRRLIAILFLLRCVSSIFGATLYVTVSRDLELFLLLYLIGAYYGLHRRAMYIGSGSAEQRGWKAWALYLIVIAAVFYAVEIGMCLLYRSTGTAAFLEHMTILLEPAKILGGACLFKLVEQLPSLRSKRINSLARMVPGVYMLHENQIVKLHIWTDIHPVLPFLDTAMFLPAMLIKAAAVYAVCLVIDAPWTCLVRPWLSKKLGRSRLLSQRKGGAAEDDDSPE